MDRHSHVEAEVIILLGEANMAIEYQEHLPGCRPCFVIWLQVQSHGKSLLVLAHRRVDAFLSRTDSFEGRPEVS